ncbi:complement C3-like [Aplochiton taeniatus]
MSAPNLLRVGIEEAIFVEIQDNTGGPVNVRIMVKPYPKKQKLLSSTNVELNAENNFQALASILIHEDNFASARHGQRQYVYLQAAFPDRMLEKVVLLSFQSGYIFIQTDQTVYTPDSRVLYRVFAVNPNMEPVSRDKRATSISIEIMTPDNITISREIVTPNAGSISGAFSLQGIVSQGMWRVVCRFLSIPQQTFSTVFEVKEYGEMGEAERKGIQIATSPYTIQFKRTPKFFVPGMPFDVIVLISNPDESPAVGVPVLINPGNVLAMTTASGVAIATVNSLAAANMLRIMILSRGQLVKAGRLERRGQPLLMMSLAVTKDMVPSFRIVAYYHVGTNEVVSDSVWMDVKDGCMGSLKLESRRSRPFYEPGRLFDLRVTGDPGAMVGLVMVGMGANEPSNRHRLTQRKVWDIVETYDPGCTPGGGKDSMGVFSDAGLMFESSTASGTDIRQGNRAEPLFHSCPATTSRDETALLPDSTGTWQVTAISLSRTQGICVSDPFEVIIVKDFFIDLQLPYSAVGSEQLEIKAVLHNYSPKDLLVRVELIEAADVCSSASRRGSFRQEVTVSPSSTRVVPFVIIPMAIGDFPIEVKAAVRGSGLSDGIKRTLRVVMLDVPVEKVLSGLSMARLFVQPTGSGEGTMTMMTLPLIATVYLDKTDQWKDVGLNLRNTAIQYITTGYVRQLTFRKADGSYSVFIGRPSSTWLTAYVAKLFVMASDLVEVADDKICSAIKWLILNSQQPDGKFTESGDTLRVEMTGDVRGLDADALMTAFVLIAMQEAHPLCEFTVYGGRCVYTRRHLERNLFPVQSMKDSMHSAVTYLERRLNTLTNPYAVARTSYALANAGKLNKEILYRFVSQGLDHWYVPGRSEYTLEATAYALLALVKVKAFEDARPILKWLNTREQQVSEGGSTQPRFKSQERNATMSVLDIGLLTGFEPDIGDLDMLLKGDSRYIEKYEMSRVLSDRGSLIIHLDKVSHEQPEEISFRIHQRLKSRVLQPAAVSVYEYYEQRRCVKFYHPESKDGQLLRSCAVYKASVESFEANQTIDRYYLRVKKVIKEGAYLGVFKTTPFSTDKDRVLDLVPFRIFGALVLRCEPARVSIQSV